MQNCRMGRKKEYLCLLLLTAGFGLLYLSLCFNDNIWTDEAFTIDLLRNCDTYGEAVWFTAGDVHPPLYYLILKPFTDWFGLHLILLKVLSIVPMLLTMGLGFWVRRRFGFRTAFLYLLTLGAIPCAMEYAVQVRMYAWAMLFVTVCGMAAYDAFVSGGNGSWILLWASGVAAAYTHYFALIAVVWIYGFLFLALFAAPEKRRRLAGWGLCAALSLAAYAPWMRILQAQVSGVAKNYWIPGIDLDVMLGYFDTLFETDLPGGTQLLTVLFALAALSLAADLYRSLRRMGTEREAGEGQDRLREDVAGLLAFVLPAVVAATGVLLSLLIRPIFIARYLMPCIPLFCLSFALAFSRLDGRVYGALLAFLFFLMTVVYRENWHTEYTSTRVPQTEAFFAEHLGENDLIVYNFKIFDFIYQYYFPPEQLCYIEDVDLSGDYDTIWLLDTHLNPEFSPEQLAAYGWKQSFEGNYGIEHDEFKLYRISKSE